MTNRSDAAHGEASRPANLVCIGDLDLALRNTKDPTQRLTADSSIASYKDQRRLTRDDETKRLDDRA
jgi:hypothetical protein